MIAPATCVEQHGKTGIAVLGARACSACGGVCVSSLPRSLIDCSSILRSAILAYIVEPSRSAGTHAVWYQCVWHHSHGAT